MFSTKGKEVPESGSGKVYKGLNAGIHNVAIMDMEVFTSQGGSSVINLSVEDKNSVEEGYEYKGLLGEHVAKNHTANVTMGSWFKSGDDPDPIMQNLASIANATGTRELVDNITGANTLEEYLVKFINIVKGIYFWTIIQEREYENGNGDVKTSKNIKNMKAGDNYVVLAKPDSFEVVEEAGQKVLTDGTWKLAFSEEYDVKKLAKPDSDKVDNPVAGEGSDNLPF